MHERRIIMSCTSLATLVLSLAILAEDRAYQAMPAKSPTASDDPRSMGRASEDTSAESNEDRKSQHPNSGKQPEQYLSFGSTQIYASSTEVWLFLDVDLHTVRGGYAEPPDICERKEFHVYVLQRGGVRWKWKTSDVPLTAHSNFATFFRYGRDTFAYLLQQGRLYRWSVNPDGTAGFVLVEAPETVVGSQPSKTSEMIERLAKLSNAAGFRKIDAGFYGYGTFPPLDYVASHVNLRLRFEQIRGGLGWCAVQAESLSSPPEWKEALLRLDDSRRENKRNSAPQR